MTLSKAHKHAAEAIFCALDQMDLLTIPTLAQKPIPFSDIFAYVHQSDFQVNDAFKSALSINFSLHRTIRQLLSKKPLATINQAAAASTGPIDTREGQDFKVQLIPSQADLAQVFLQITYWGSEQIPRFLFILEENGPIHRLEIDDFYDGEAQILMNFQNDAVKALRSIKTTVILRA